MTRADIYPRTPGWRDQPTSVEAAKAIAPNVGRLRDRVLHQIAAYGGLTADEAAKTLGLTEFSVRPRCTELKELGETVDSGLRRKNASGRWAIVWAAL